MMGNVEWQWQSVLVVMLCANFGLIASIAAADAITVSAALSHIPAILFAKVESRRSGSSPPYSRCTCDNTAALHRPTAAQTTTKFSTWRRFSRFPPANSATICKTCGNKMKYINMC